jgi:hypothetical protein
MSKKKRENLFSMSKKNSLFALLIRVNRCLPWEILAIFCECEVSVEINNNN